MKPNSMRHYYNYLSYTLIDNRKYRFIKMSYISNVFNFSDMSRIMDSFDPVMDSASVMHKVLEGTISLLCQNFNVPTSDVKLSGTESGTYKVINLQYHDTLFCSIFLEKSTDHEIRRKSSSFQFVPDGAKDDATEYIFIRIATYRAATWGSSLISEFNILNYSKVEEERVSILEEKIRFQITINSAFYIRF